ncbi:MAG TPA: YfiR family protein [Holophagaceae bacterium]|nr:YfiR family protein [Holophagaceae bacterium]
MGVLALLLGGLVARAQAPEYEVKGVFMYKFGDYVEWPVTAFDGPGTPFTIGILGDDPFDGTLDQIVQNRTIQGRPVTIKRFHRVDEVRGVQILYLGASETERWQKDLENLKGMTILTVSDQTRKPGAVITFVLKDKKVRFEIDEDAAGRAGLKLSSKLLSLATSVRKKGESA